MKDLSAVSVTDACRMNQTGKGNRAKKLYHSLVVTFLNFREAANECVQMSIMFNAAYVVMWRLASLLNVLCKLLGESFDPYVVVQRKTTTTVSYDKWGTTFLLIV